LTLAFKHDATLDKENLARWPIQFFLKKEPKTVAQRGFNR
jgi:hypothetical protein